MYKTVPDELQNEKCFYCKYCVWDEDRKTEVCDIKGCYKNNKFVWFGDQEYERLLSNQ